MPQQRLKIVCGTAKTGDSQVNKQIKINFFKWSKKVSNYFTQALHKPYPGRWGTAENIYRIKVSLNKCLYGRSEVILWSLGFFLHTREDSHVPCDTLWDSVNMGPEIQGSIGQSCRACLWFLCRRKICKELRDRCEGGQSQLRSHPLQECSAQLPKLGIPFHLLH